MPPFPERESSILAKLKKKKGPSTVTGLEDSRRERGADVNGGPEPTPASTAVGPSLTPGPCTSSRGAQSLRFAHWGQCVWNTPARWRQARGLHLSFPGTQKLFSSRHPASCFPGFFALLSGVPVQLPDPPCLDC